MSKYFEVDFRTGSFQDRTGRRTVTVTGTPNINNGEKGSCSRLTLGSVLTYSSSVLPDAAFTIVIYARLQLYTKGINTRSTQIVGVGNQGVYLKVDHGDSPYLQFATDNAKSFNYSHDNNWHCFIFTISGNAQTDIVNAALYVDGVSKSSSAIYSSTPQGSRSGYTTLSGDSSTNISKTQLAYLATYDHVFTESERNSEQRDFEMSYPMISPEIIDFPKPMDLSREKDNILTRLLDPLNFMDATWALNDNGFKIDANSFGSNSSGAGGLTVSLSSLPVGKKIKITIKGTITSGPAGFALRDGPTIKYSSGGNIDYTGEFTLANYLYLSLNNVSSTVTITELIIQEVSGLTAAYNMIPQGTVLPDISGNGKNGTLTKVISTKNGLQSHRVTTGLAAPFVFPTMTVRSISMRIKFIPVSNPVYYIINMGNVDDDRFFFNYGFFNFGGVWSPTLYVNGVSGVSTGVLDQWYTLTIVSNVNVTGPMEILGRSGVISLAEVADIRLYNRALSLQEIQAYHNQFAKRPTLTETFSDEGADGIAKVPTGWVKQSGSFKIGEIRGLGNLYPGGGTFDSSTGLSVPAEVTISGGKANWNASSDSYLDAAGIVELGKLYRVTYTVSNYVSGRIHFQFGDGTDGIIIGDSNGTFTNIRKSTGWTSTYFISSVALGFVGSIDNVTVEEVVPPTIKKGSKYLECVTAGTITLPSKQTYGTWEWDWYQGTSSSSVEIYFISGNPKKFPNCIKTYSLVGDATRAVVLYIANISTATALLKTINAYFSKDTWYRFKVIRTVTGQFTVYIKGGSFGNTTWTLISTTGGTGTNPVTDNTYTTSEYFVVDLDAGDRIANIKLTEGIEQ